jgi:hypothetical protein
MRELNLSGMWNVVTFALRRWLTDDGVWPKVVARWQCSCATPALR